MKEALKRTEVLNEGYVELLDVMGSDETICDAARVSYNDASKRSNDRNLIRYMWSNLHSSPFEQVVFQFRCKMPIFIARQWVRHRTARLNEISGRYSELPEEFYDYCEQGLPLQSQTNNQGSELEQYHDQEFWIGRLEEHNTKGFEIYHDLLEAGVSKEIARCHLPLSTYTQWYWQMDLHNLLHFLELRMDPHAQAEIRVYANAIYDMIKEYVPLTVEAFEDYTLNSMKLSRMEIEALRAIGNGLYDGTYTLEELNKNLHWGMSTRELDAFEKKLKRLGL